MKTAKMLFVGSLKVYNYDTKEDLKPEEKYTSSTYLGKILEVVEVFPKDENQILPFKIKELIIGKQPENPEKNNVYITKI